MNVEELYHDAAELLKKLISTPSFSKEEGQTAFLLQSFLHSKHTKTQRHLNNIIAVNEHYDPAKPTILLNSHHDTVKPNPQYTKDPFSPIIEDGKLYGLGSNDAGGCLVSLIATFIYFHQQKNLRYNIILAATGEEEISGLDGIEAVIPILPKIDFAIVGEPTMMQLAIAEKGLMVLDCVAHGKAGHAAREEGDNAIYKAMKDIEWISSYKFDKQSDWLGPVKMSVTSVHSENKAHNMVPSTCNFIIDARITDIYSHEEVLDIIRKNVSSEVKPRSMRMRSTRIDVNHLIVQAGIQLGKKPYGSPTSSDKALMPFPALKCGPGDSARSHSADEFIYLDEIKKGIEIYINLISKVIT